jgi:hypothetical protein
MPIFIKQGGADKKLKQPFVKVAGIAKPVQKGFEKQGGVWVKVYAAEIVATITANVNNINLSTLFSAADWASTTKKRVVINDGVVIGGIGGSSALLTGLGLVGTLQIDNAGDIRGYGGAANGGAGGPAVNVQTAGVTINNSGVIRGGGGGGGHGGTGGTGGAGYYNYTATEGPAYNRTGAPSYWFSESRINGLKAASWAGQAWNNPPWSWTDGPYTYYASTKQESVNSVDYYSIYRQYTATANTSGGAGGAGGNGGAGAGANQSQTAGAGGSPGAAGGTNAGSGGYGGTGGTGGTWGAPGSAGNQGAVGNAGNAGGGSGGGVGTAGGAAGAAITGVARTVNNTGTIQGTY